MVSDMHRSQQERGMTIIPLMLRLPDDLHAKIKACAQENDRSLNQEIVNRLRRSLEVYRR
jgi:predicted HicB family RNase H-like nuclease